MLPFVFAFVCANPRQVRVKRQGYQWCFISGKNKNAAAGI